MGLFSRSTETRAKKTPRLADASRSLLTRHVPETGRSSRVVKGQGSQLDLPVLPSERLQPSKRPIYTQPVIRRSRK